MKRFYSDVSIAEAEGAYSVRLDTRPIRTAGGKPQLIPTRALAEAVANEWSGQGEEIDPDRFRLRDLVDYAIDIVAPDRAATIAKLLAFGETDTLCYRADPEDALYRRQQMLWDPLLGEFEALHGIRLNRVSGIIHRPQPAEAVEGMSDILSTLDGFTLAGLHTLASLSASLIIGLCALVPGADPDQLWNAANLEELWQAELWGSDAEAETRLARRRQDFLCAFEFVRLLGS